MHICLCDGFSRITKVGTFQGKERFQQICQLKLAVDTFKKKLDSQDAKKCKSLETEANLVFKNKKYLLFSFKQSHDVTCVVRRLV